MDSNQTNGPIPENPAQNAAPQPQPVADTTAQPVTPTLTLDPFGAAPQAQGSPFTVPTPNLSTAAAPANVSSRSEEIMEIEKRLSPEELKMVEDFSAQIDITDTNSIMTYGAATQQKMADFSDQALDSVRTKDMGQVGELLTGVVAELRSFNEEEKGGFMGLFKKQTSKLATMKSRYDKAEVNVTKIVDALQAHEVQLMKDTATLDKMYEMNLAYFKELTMYILAGKKKLQEAETVVLPQLQEKARQSGLAEDAQAARDYQDMCERFSKKLTDLELTRTISMQTAPQIRMIQANDIQMVDKIRSTVVNTIPLWKSQMVIALGIQNSTEAARAQRAVTDVTNQMLTANAEALKIASVETEKEAQRGVVDIETLQKTNQSLIETFDEVMRIQTEGRAKRQEAEAEMLRMETELKNKLLEVRGQ
ncbi:MAG: toxic anion resistance protein [Lachnospiraceae bacterium]|nr:toxic anion resistance protein [Lachnospiraceae bacterium]